MKNKDVVRKKHKPKSRQKVVEFFKRRYGSVKGNSFAKKYRRLKKYKATNQYRDGQFYCKGNKPITEARVGQYDGMFHKLIREYFPALFVNEAAYNYDDLAMACRVEVFLALLDGFDPAKAMTSTKEDPVLRAEIEASKAANPEGALERAEKNIVWGRLHNYLRRTRWKYHPSQRGGMTGSLDFLLKPSNSATRSGTSSEGVSYNEYKRGLFTPAEEECSEILDLKQRLIGVLEDKGVEEAKALFMTLPAEYREAVVDILVRDGKRREGYSGLESETEEECENEKTESMNQVG